ncbi:MAG TPA: PP2C family protein-serine/threonine phosphatase [Solirubrobacteraceae bacterium]
MLARTSRRQQREGLAHVAHTLERSLLPDALPDVPGLQLASAYRPATAGSQAGGDFYDAFLLDHFCWLAIGDICGKDAAAAALTAMVRHSIRALAFLESSPAHILRTVNDVMLSHELSGRFATAILARIDLSPPASSLSSPPASSLSSPPASSLSSPAASSLSSLSAPSISSTASLAPQLTLASAGHPGPLLLHPNGHAHSPPVAGTLLGVLSQPSIHDLTLSLPPGSTLFLYTDGLTDAGAPSRAISTAELRHQLACHPGSSVAELVRDLEQLALARGQGHLRDDIAILAARLI